MWNSCKWVEKCWDVQNTVKSVDGRCCGEAPSSVSLKWFGDGKITTLVGRKKRKVIPGQTDEGQIGNQDDDDDEPDGDNHPTVHLKVNGSDGPLTIPFGYVLNWTTTGTAEGFVFFLGTVNGTNGEAEVGTTSLQAPFSIVQPGSGPELITRYVEIRDNNGNAIARSNVVTVTVEPPPTAPSCSAPWTQIAEEGGWMEFTDNVDIAFGSSPFDPTKIYDFKYDVSGLIHFTNSFFGSDPDPNEPKYGFYRCTGPLTAPACPAHYVQIAEEGQQVNFVDPVDVAFGTGPFDTNANDYIFISNAGPLVNFDTNTFGPIFSSWTGRAKFGYFKCHVPPTAPACSIDWMPIGQLGDTWTFNDSVEIAYGPGPTYDTTSSLYTRMLSTTGVVNFDFATFDDPLPGEAKYFFYRCTPTTPTPIPTLYNTGQGLPDGSTDPNWTVIQTPDPNDPPTPFNAIVTIHPWAVNDATSSFITTRNNLDNTAASADPGEYRFQTTFDLTGLDPSTVSITFYVEDDNQLTDLLLNGTSTGINGYGTDIWNNPQTVTTGFVSGVNTLVFVVINDAGGGGNIVGLRVKFVSLT